MAPSVGARSGVPRAIAASGSIDPIIVAAAEATHAASMQSLHHVDHIDAAARPTPRRDPSSRTAPGNGMLPPAARARRASRL